MQHRETCSKMVRVRLSRAWISVKKTSADHDTACPPLLHIPHATMCKYLDDRDMCLVISLASLMTAYTSHTLALAVYWRRGKHWGVLTDLPKAPHIFLLIAEAMPSHSLRLELHWVVEEESLAYYLGLRAENGSFAGNVCPIITQCYPTHFSIFGYRADRSALCYGLEFNLLAGRFS